MNDLISTLKKRKWKNAGVVLSQVLAYLYHLAGASDGKKAAPVALLRKSCSLSNYKLWSASDETLNLCNHAGWARSKGSCSPP